MEALMGEKLKFIGGLMEEDEQPAVAAPPATRGNRVRNALLASLGLAAAAALLLTLWAPWSSPEEAEAKPDQSGIVACSKLIVTGTVSGTEAAGDEKVRIRLNVEKYLKPSTGPGKSEFLVPEQDGAAYKTGARVLVSVSRFDGEVPLLFTGREIEPTWEWMEAEVGNPDTPACSGRG